MTAISHEDCLVTKHRQLDSSYHSLIFGSFAGAAKCRPGHFIHVRLPHSNIYFRRAMSVASVDCENSEIEIIFKVFGRGTRILSTYREADRVDILGPLGVPFEMPNRSETTIIIAGGIGFPPLFYLATQMMNQGYNPGSIEFFYGGRSAADILERCRIEKLGVNFHPVTDDGTTGCKGLVTEAVEAYLDDRPGENHRLYACGPEAMLKAADALARRYDMPGQLSLEAPMPCGIGICLGCVVPLAAGGHARVCCEGPVFNVGEVIL